MDFLHTVLSSGYHELEGSGNYLPIYGGCWTGYFENGMAKPDTVKGIFRIQVIHTTYMNGHISIGSQY